MLVVFCFSVDLFTAGLISDAEYLCSSFSTLCLSDFNSDAGIVLLCLFNFNSAELNSVLACNLAKLVLLSVPFVSDLMSVLLSLLIFCLVLLDSDLISDDEINEADCLVLSTICCVLLLVSETDCFASMFLFCFSSDLISEIGVCEMAVLFSLLVLFLILVLSCAVLSATFDVLLVLLLVSVLAD